MSVGLEAMVRQMERALGWGEPWNPAQKWYAQRNGAEFGAAAWCNMLITWAAFMSGNYKAVCYGKDWALTNWHAAAGIRHGNWHYGPTGIRRGDIVFIQWEGGRADIGKIDHVGVVTDVEKGTKWPLIETIEGNTADKCRRRIRWGDDRISGYIRPEYPESKEDFMASIDDLMAHRIKTDENQSMRFDTLLGHFEKSQDRMEEMLKELVAGMAELRDALTEKPTE